MILFVHLPYSKSRVDREITALFHLKNINIVGSLWKENSENTWGLYLQNYLCKTHMIAHTIVTKNVFLPQK